MFKEMFLTATLSKGVMHDSKVITNEEVLKMATINVEEYYQNVRLQFSSELPSATTGIGSGLFKTAGLTKTNIGFGLPIRKPTQTVFLSNSVKAPNTKRYMRILISTHEIYLTF